MFKSSGNNGNNADPMLSIRCEPRKNEITGHAFKQIKKLIESLDIKDNNLSEKIKIKDLINIYKWDYVFCNAITFLPIFSDIIDDGTIKIVDIPKFDKLIYKVMGEYDDKIIG